MKRFILLVVFALSSAFAAVDLNKPIAELRLKDGRTLKNVVLVSYSNSAVMAKWEGGRGTLAYQLFPDEYQPVLASMRPKPSSAAPTAEKKEVPVPKSPPAVKPASPPPAVEAATGVRKIVGEIFFGGGESQSVRVKFAAVTVVAYPLAEVQSALETNLTPTLPPPIGSAETDSEGRFEIEVPSAAKFMLIAKARHRAMKGGRVTDWEWRITDSEISGNRAMLHEGNAFSGPNSQITIQRR